VRVRTTLDSSADSTAAAPARVVVTAARPDVR
jgi:hypothetical protein